MIISYKNKSIKRLFRWHLGLFWLLTGYFGYSYHRTIIDYQELILHGYVENTRTINTYFINFILSVARLTIYKSRQIMVFESKDIDTIKLFLFTMHKYVQYAFTYYKMSNRLPLFIKYFDVDNLLIRFQNDSVQLLL